MRRFTRMCLENWQLRVDRSTGKRNVSGLCLWSVDALCPHLSEQLRQSSFVRADCQSRWISADGPKQICQSTLCRAFFCHSNCCKADFVERPSQSRFIIPDLLELICQRRCFRTDCSKRLFCQNRILRAPFSEQISESSFLRADSSEKMFQSKLCRADCSEQSWQ